MRLGYLYRGRYRSGAAADEREDEGRHQWADPTRRCAHDEAATRRIA